MIAIVIDTIQEFKDDRIAGIAGSLAFFTILSLAPLLLITVSVVGVVTDRDTVEGEVYQEISDAAGTRAADLVQDMVRNVNETRSGGIAALFGIVTLLYGAISIFGQLQEALNAVWEVDVRPEEGLVRTIKRRLWAAMMLPVTGLVLLLALATDTALSAVVHYLGDEVSQLALVYVLQVVSLVAFTLVITFLFAFIYRYLPDVEIEWNDVIIGAAVTAVLFIIGQTLLSLYLTRGSVSSTYGAAGTFMVVLLWVYYSAQIFLFGAEFTQAYARRRGKDIQPSSYAYHVKRRGQLEHSQEPA